MRPAIHPETIDLIVAEYQADAPARARDANDWRADGQPFSRVIDQVGMAGQYGKRHPHQRRLTRQALAAGTAALHAIAEQLAEAGTFDVLLDRVAAAFEPIRGLGELAVYDAAERLRHRLGLEGRHLIYLHAGARVGARRLAGGRLAKEDAYGILRHQVPQGLRHLTTHEIEDILCTYKDELLLTPDQFRARRGDGPGPRCGPPEGPRPSC